jgi:hypothetical protein
MALTALFPALLAEQHDRAFVIGLGTGVSAGELAVLEATQQVTVAEISRAVIAANPLFAEGNLGVSKSPKVEIIRGDAYRTLLRSRERYDVIVSEPSNPWVAGVEMLYSREFLEAARARLAPGGVYGQWFHVYETDDRIVDMVFRTYVSVFPNVAVWFTGPVDLLLIGIDRPERALDARALEARFQQPDFAAGFARAGIVNFAQLLAHELIPLGTLHAEPLEGPVHTLRAPILSDWAARTFFRGGRAWLGPYSSEEHQRVSVRNSLLHRYAGGGGSLSEEILEIAAREMCRVNRRADCATFLARWAVDHPESARRSETLTMLRKRARPVNEDIASPRLQELVTFYGGGSSGERDALTAEEAEYLTSRFLKFYHHAVPFDRGALGAIWDRCSGQGCEAGRRRAEADLWGFDGD